MNIFEKMDDAYIYGPLQEEDVQNIPVPHRIIREQEGYYVGTGMNQDQWSDKLIPRPEPVSNNDQPVAEQQ